MFLKHMKESGFKILKIILIPDPNYWMKLFKNE